MLITFFQSHKFRLIVVILFLLFTFGCSTPPPTTNNEFQYLVRVQDANSGTAVINATVIIEVTGKTSLIEVTDTYGYARFYIDDIRAGQPGKLRIIATGYREYALNIDLALNRLPKDIQIIPSASTITPTSTAASFSTATLSSSATSAPSPIATFTSSPIKPTSTSTPLPTPTFTPTLQTASREIPFKFFNNDFDLDANLNGWENPGSAQRVLGLKGNGIQIRNINNNSDVYYNLGGVFSGTRTFYLVAWCQTDSGTTCKISLSGSNSGGTRTLVTKEILGGKVWQQIKTPPAKTGGDSNLKITLHAPSAIGDVINYDEVELFEVLP